jgi:predicted nucleic acid-binding protein
MNSKFLIDTVILIDHLNGINAATDWLKGHSDGESTISVITRAEVLTGATDAEMADINLFLDNYLCLGINKGVADKAAKLRRKYRWKLPDAFQAALAISHKMQLVTRNTKDFNEKKHAFVTIPYRIKNPKYI